MNPAGAVRRNLLPILTAASVFALIVIRACVQSITIDEADTYLAYVARPEASHWWPAANNHVLNSMLMRMFVTGFGPSELTLRIPALIGALLYVLACYRMCLLLTERVGMRVILLVCLTCNPFVLDYLVAARGYGLAVGLLTAAVVVAAQSGLREAPVSEGRIRRTCGVVSLLLGLSFCANFSFAIVDAVMLFALCVWLYRRSGTLRDWRRGGVLAAWSIVPGLIPFLLFAAPVVVNFPKAQLVFGAKSVAEMRSSLLRASLFRINPEIVGPLFYAAVDALKHALVPLILSAFAIQGIALGVCFRRMDERSRRRTELAALVAGVVIVVFLLHWIMFRAFKVLLPMDRTGLYFVSLSTLAISIAAAVQAPWRVSVIGRRFLAAALAVLAGYFVCCLRLTYFKEWEWNADNRELYGVVARYARDLETRDVESHWKWVSSLNYYRSVSGQDAFNEVSGARDQHSTDKKLYVLDAPFEQQFIHDQKLEVVYHGERSDVAVAIRKEAPASAVETPVSARVKNLSRLGASDFYAGERFQVIVNGPPGRDVYVNARHGSKMPGAARYGKTDESGRFSLEGEMDDQHLGQWTEVWSVGNASAPPIRFRVKPGKSSAPAAK